MVKCLQAFPIGWIHHHLLDIPLLFIRVAPGEQGSGSVSCREPFLMFKMIFSQ